MSDGKRIVLSHAAEDTVFARRLANLLAERGVEVFIDANVTAGEDWSRAFRHEIEEASALVLLIPSDTARNRNNLWFEAGAARALEKRVLAVLPPDRHATDYPNDLADVMVLDADRRPLEDIADTLVQAAPSRQPAHVHPGE